MEILVPDQGLGNQRILFVENAQTVGEITLEPRKDGIYLWSFSIYEPFRKLRLGYQAMKELVNFVKGKKLELHVWKDNEPAIKVYKAAGFKIVDDRPDRCTYNMIHDLDNPEG